MTTARSRWMPLGAPYGGRVSSSTSRISTRKLKLIRKLPRTGCPNEVVREQVALLAEHVIAASEITRLFPSARLRSLTDPLLWEVGRLLAWSNQE